MGDDGEAPDRLTMQVGEVDRDGGPAGTEPSGDTPSGGVDGAGDNDGSGQVSESAGSRRTAHRIWPWALALGLAVAGTFAVLMAQPQEPVVTVESLFGPTGQPVPSAPDHQVARRWFRELPAGTDLVGLGIHDDLVVAHVSPRTQDDDPRTSTVLAWDTATGEVAWTTPLAWPGQVDAGRSEPEPPVVVLVDGALTTGVLEASRRGVTAGILAVDAGDGSVAWSRLLPSPGVVALYPDRQRATIRTVDSRQTADPDALGLGEVVVDLADGEVMFIAEGTLVPRDGGWFSFDPEATRRWAVVDEDGTITMRVASEAAPTMLGELIVTAQGTTITATTPSGDPAWEAVLPGTDTVPATEVFVSLGEAGDGTLVAGAYRTSDNEVGRLQDYVTSRVFPDGRTEELDSDIVRQHALDTGLTMITVDGAPLLACAARIGDPGASCPASLALVDLDGTVAARVDDVVVLRGPADGIPLPGTATTRGLVVVEPDALRLRSWVDLAPLWEIEVPPSQETVIATSGTGVAVGLAGATPSVTWLS